MKRAAIIICWICVIAAGAFLRSDHLERRPFHADEATGARITATRMTTQQATFDPSHFHGPLLADLAIPLCRLRHETNWSQMTPFTLRLLTVIAGTLLVAVPLLWRRRIGDLPALAAATFFATSPLLVYYSRMFIHESLLTLFGMLALTALVGRPRPAIGGILLGLMFATKETFAISVIAWIAAGFWLAIEFQRKSTIFQQWKCLLPTASILILTAAFTASLFYTDFFRHPTGAIDAVRTFFVYQTGDGHDKNLTYYANLLAIPKKSAGTWWFETPILILALAACIPAFFYQSNQPSRQRVILRFIAISAAAHFAIYSIIAYKTPWLACLPWAHVCLLAGCGLPLLWSRNHFSNSLIALTITATILSQSRQSWMATGRYESDIRNPYAYAPTQRDVESLAPWLRQLDSHAGPLTTIAVIGSDYWPLPWALRTFHQTGYWPTPPDNLTNMPIVFAAENAQPSVTTLLEHSHVALPRGLRADVPLLMFVRNDVWQRWMDSPSP